MSEADSAPILIFYKMTFQPMLDGLGVWSFEIRIKLGLVGTPYEND